MAQWPECGLPTPTPYRLTAARSDDNNNSVEQAHNTAGLENGVARLSGSLCQPTGRPWHSGPSAASPLPRSTHSQQHVHTTSWAQPKRGATCRAWKIKLRDSRGIFASRLARQEQTPECGLAIAKSYTLTAASLDDGMGSLEHTRSMVGLQKWSCEPQGVYALADRKAMAQRPECGLPTPTPYRLTAARSDDIMGPAEQGSNLSGLEN